MNVNNLAEPALLALAASKARTTVTLEQISTKVLKAPIGSLRCTSCVAGQADAPEPQHNVSANQTGKKHNFSRQEQPHDRLAQRKRQAGLILQLQMMRMFVMHGGSSCHSVCGLVSKPVIIETLDARWIFKNG